MKIKKIIIFALLLLTSVITISFFTTSEVLGNDSFFEMKKDELNDRNQNMQIPLDPVKYGWGIGGLAGDSYSSGAGGYGGGAVIAGIYYLAKEVGNWFNSLFNNNNNYQIENNSISIDDVLNYPDIKEGMDKYSWTKERLKNGLII